MSDTELERDAPEPERSDVMQVMDRPWVIVVLLLHVGFLGIPIYWKTKYSVGTRVWICVASIVYTVAAVAFIIVMIRWIMEMMSELSNR
ncbi:MAG: hypothetical protein AAGG48_06655 [Planctomycetota bacterium]